LSIKYANAKLIKHMTTEPPRRIQKLDAKIHLEKQFTHEQRLNLEDIAKTCPVAVSLSPEIVVQMQFVYDL